MGCRLANREHGLKRSCTSGIATSTSLRHRWLDISAGQRDWSIWTCSPGQVFALFATQTVKVFGEEVIKGKNGPLYRLVFASKHERGLEFWDKITKKELGGQGRFTFE